MGLFNGEPLTPEEIQAMQVAVRAQEGATVRKVSKAGTAYTARHRPWAELLGAGPPDTTCGECQHLTFHQCSVKYFKCGRQVITASRGSDIRKKDPSCRLFAITSR